MRPYVLLNPAELASRQTQAQRQAARIEREVSSKLPRRFPSAQTLDLYGVPNPSIKLHYLHPPPSAVTPKGYLLP